MMASVSQVERHPVIHSGDDSSDFQNSRHIGACMLKKWGCRGLVDVSKGCTIMPPPLPPFLPIAHLLTTSYYIGY